MTPADGRTRRLCLVLLVALLGAETVFFARRCAADFFRISGERAFFRNDHLAAWRRYGTARALAGDPTEVETDMVELLLFGLDQESAGVNVKTPFPPEEAVERAGMLIRRRLKEEPYRAYLWSLASDIYLQQARLRRSREVLDLASVFEEPLRNLNVEEWLGLAALERAARLEPSNFVYADLLVETYETMGRVADAARWCRRAVGGLPVLSAHKYLGRKDLDREVLEAAVAGFDDARRSGSLIAESAVVSDAGALLLRHGERRRALGYLEEALRLAPEAYDAAFYAGIAHQGLEEHAEAVAMFARAETIEPESAWASFYLGTSQSALGRNDEATAALRRARAKDPREIRFASRLAALLEEAGRHDEAERHLLAFAHQNPSNAMALANLLDFYIRRSDFRSGSRVCAQRKRQVAESRDVMQRCAAIDNVFAGRALP